MHAWDCRRCRTRNAPAFTRCRSCGALRMTGWEVRTIHGTGHGASLWRMAREVAATSLVVALLAPLAFLVVGLVLLAGLPPVGLILLALAVGYLARIARPSPP